MVIMLIGFGASRLNDRIPGFVYAFMLVFFAIGRTLEEVPLPLIWKKLTRWPAWLAPYGIAQVGLILFLRGLFAHEPMTWALGLGFALALGNLLRFRRQLPPVAWLMLLAILLYTWKIDGWQFAVAGDEFDYYDLSMGISTPQDYQFMNANLLAGRAIPYLSSVLQAASELFFGRDNFGWRFSSLYMAAAAIVPFYLFFKHFIHKNLALLVAGLLSVSSYLMDFGKIGYNNLQALLVMALVLWLAAESARRGRLLHFTLLGLAMGAGFYTYPGALYVLPLPLLLLLFFYPPKTRLMLGRYLWLAGTLLLAILPLLPQSDYWQVKIAGTLFNHPEIITDGGLVFHFGSNFIQALFSFVFIPNETHFVVSSYVDPLTAVFIPFGMAWCLKQVRRERFILFVLLGYLEVLLAAGTTHDRQFPPTTRMFLLLPFFAFFAALGFNWVWQGFKRWGFPGRRLAWLAGLTLAALCVLNIYQAYPLSHWRNIGNTPLDMVFLRLLQCDAQRGDVNKTYVFITAPDWSIEGLRRQSAVYQLPDAEAQLVQVTALDGEIPPDAMERIRLEDTFVIIQPWMDSAQSESIANTLTGLGKMPAVQRSAPGAEERFVLWYSSKWLGLVPAEGYWR